MWGREEDAKLRSARGHFLTAPLPKTDPAAIRAGLAAGSIRRVLAVRVARVGDTLHVRPALELLRAALPEAFVAFLCSDQANWLRGPIFGAGGDRVVVLEQPKYGTGMYKEGGWSTEDLVRGFAANLKKHLEPVGLMKNPYPFYDGVTPKN